MADHVFQYGGKELRLTVTFGVSEFEGEMTFDDSLALADRALYYGKAAGRNVVEVERERHYRVKATSSEAGV